MNVSISRRSPAPSPPDPRAGRRRCLPPARLLAGFVLVLVACAGPGTEHEGDRRIQASFGLSPTPPMMGAAQVWVAPTFEGSPLGDSVTVRAAPVAPGGVVGDKVELAPMDPGRWEGELIFRIAGEGQLQVEVEVPDGPRAVLRFPVTVSRRALAPGR